MIDSIRIQNVASYGEKEETLSGLAQFNYIYGPNATGKTTISRIIADDSAYADSRVTWKGGTTLQTLVYNRDFIEQNFNQPDDLKGVFTLGEKNKDTLDRIHEKKQNLDDILNDIATLTRTLEGNGGISGKRADLLDLESRFEERCWLLKQKYDGKFKNAFTGVRGKKRDFKSKILSEHSNNTSSAVPLSELEDKAKALLEENPQPISPLPTPDLRALLASESNPILQKNVVGSSDVAITDAIQRLGNSDWVRQGLRYYDVNDRTCPFCQRRTDEGLATALGEYFDDSFERDTIEIERIGHRYGADSQRVAKELGELLSASSEFLDIEDLQGAKERLNSAIRLNVQRIEDKKREPSRSVELVSLHAVATSLSSIVTAANRKIREHNRVVSDFRNERRRLIGQIWKYLLDNEVEQDLTTYLKQRAGIEKAIGALEKKLREGRADQLRKEREIAELERHTTSIQPTIDQINALLTSFGFEGFRLAKSERDRFYRVVRPDGSDAKGTLSEGEKSFVSFLYFHHLLKGSDSESGTTTDRIVVFDDPVSSLDSEILFIVSSLIKGLFQDVRDGVGPVKQGFVLTHNVYFHKEVTYNPKRKVGKLREETFWTVKKRNHASVVERHNENPIRTAYELLWAEVRDGDRENFTIQNILRRILESYFKILGGVDPDRIIEKFQGQERLICKSLFSWVNDGSHSAHDDLYVSIDEGAIDAYLSVFRNIFEATGHLAHYNMMMGEPGESN